MIEVNKKTLQIRDLQAKDVVINSANLMNVPYTESFNTTELQLPEELGSGFIRATSFDHGIGVVEASYTLSQNFEFELQKDVVHPLKFIFNIGNTIEHQFKDISSKHKIEKYHSCIAASNSIHTHIFRIPNGQPINLFSLEVNRRHFESKLEQFISDLDHRLTEILRDINGVNFFYHQSSYSLLIAELIQEFKSCELKGFMRSLYLETKTYDILYQQLQQYIDDEKDGENTILRRKEIDTILSIAAFIEDHLDEEITVSQVVREFGMNQNKVQSGFQHHFKLTVNEYIQQCRLKKITELLENSDYSISEIGDRVGISSKSYISRIFKKKYGITPQEYRRHKRES